jgi:alanine racemase
MAACGYSLIEENMEISEHLGSFTVSLQALSENYSHVQELVGTDHKITVSLKGNAYGHGVVHIAKHLETLGVDTFWLGDLEEAISLRRAGSKSKLILFAGYPLSQLPTIYEYELIPTVYNESSLEAVASFAASSAIKLPIFIKVDSGLGRLGVPIGSALPFVQKAVHHQLIIEGLYSHLPFSTSEQKAWAGQRAERFFEFLISASNAGVKPDVTQVWSSSGVLARTPDRTNAVSVGHLLFGLKPFKFEGEWAFRNVLTELSAPILHVSQSESHSYSASTYYGERSEYAGVLPIGSAAGLRKGRGKKPQVLLRGKRLPIVSISLEHSIVDLAACRAVLPGDRAVLIGSQGDQNISLEDWANWCDCAPLDILTALSGRFPVSLR